MQALRQIPPERCLRNLEWIILKRRYVPGELDTEQFEAMKRQLTEN